MFERAIENDNRKDDVVEKREHDAVDSHKDDIILANSIGKNDIIPELSPFPWLSDFSWSALTQDERVELMDYVIRGLSSSDNSCYYPNSDLFQGCFVRFGQGGFNRIVLGHGDRRVLVTVGIHGNEFCGVEAVRMILQRHRLFVTDSDSCCQQELLKDCNWSVSLDDLFEKLTIEFMVGNPRALDKDKRFLSKNLNRLLDVHILDRSEKECLANDVDTAYELQRARILMEAIRDSHVMLDIHSCSANVKPFALPSSMQVSEEIAAKLPVGYVVESLAHCTAEGGTTMDWAVEQNVPGVCVECGFHRHPDVVARAANVISSFLVSQHPELEFKRSFPTKMRCEGIEIVQTGFEFINKIKEFEFIPYGVPVFRDDVQGEVTCPIKPGAFIVMPTEMPIVGEEALFWASSV